jgi:hypothetical protein
MKKQKAIKIINQRKESLNNDAFESYSWKANTINEIKNIFSDSNAKEQQIERLNFDIENVYGEPYTTNHLKKIKNQAERLLAGYILEIENHGIVKKRFSIKNLLINKEFWVIQGAILTLYLVVLSIVYGLGKDNGESNSKESIVILKSDIDSLQKKIKNYDYNMRSTEHDSTTIVK